MSAPILALLVMWKEFAIYSNVLQWGLGCVLMQYDRIIVYVFLQLKKYEKNYFTHDLELATMISTLKLRRHYLYGEHCEIYTDHSILKYLFI